MKKKCQICLNVGWVCENHPLRPWSEEIGCMCGAGMPCRCNGKEDLDVRAVVIDESEITWH
jgi:hypothetical protein